MYLYRECFIILLNNYQTINKQETRCNLCWLMYQQTSNLQHGIERTNQLHAKANLVHYLYSILITCFLL